MSGRPQATGLPHTAPVPPGRSGYTNHGCRCDDCRLANTEYHRTYKARLAAALADGASVPHGTVSTYTNWACRCEPCRAAHTEYHRTYKARLAAALADGASVPHGTVSTYTNWACRCEPCRAAQRAVHRRQRQAAPP